MNGRVFPETVVLGSFYRLKLRKLNVHSPGQLKETHLKFQHLREWLEKTFAALKLNKVQNVSGTLVDAAATCCWK